MCAKEIPGNIDLRDKRHVSMRLKKEPKNSTFPIEKQYGSSPRGDEFAPIWVNLKCL